MNLSNWSLTLKYWSYWICAIQTSRRGILSQPIAEYITVYIQTQVLHISEYKLTLVEEQFTLILIAITFIPDPTTPVVRMNLYQRESRYNRIEPKFTSLPFFDTWRLPYRNWKRIQMLLHNTALWSTPTFSNASRTGIDSLFAIYISRMSFSRQGYLSNTFTNSISRMNSATIESSCQDRILKSSGEVRVDRSCQKIWCLHPIDHQVRIYIPTFGGRHWS